MNKRSAYTIHLGTKAREVGWISSRGIFQEEKRHKRGNLKEIRKKKAETVNLENNSSINKNIILFNSDFWKYSPYECRIFGTYSRLVRTTALYRLLSHSTTQFFSPLRCFVEREYRNTSSAGKARLCPFISLWRHSGKKCDIYSLARTG